MNLYIIILGLFIISGIMLSIWGLVILVRGNRSAAWPFVTGVIETSVPSSAQDDLLPLIEYRYQIGEKQYKRRMEFPADLTPSEEFTQFYLNKYPQGSEVQVYYDSQHPENVTLEPGIGKGDWLIFVIGICTCVFGVLFLFF